MIEYVEFTNSVSGAVIVLNDDNFPMYKFETPVDVRNEEVERMQEDGMWPTYTYLGKRLVRCEGDILGSDSDDYIVKRRALLKALMPDKRNRVVGTLKLRLSGMPEDIHAQCTIDGLPEMPIEALSPTRSGYQITFKCFDPVFYGDALNLVSSDPSSDPVGRVYPKTYPRAYASISGTIGQAALINVGDREVFPIVQVYGSATQIELQHLLGPTTEVLALPGLSLSSTDVLTVDFKNRTAVSVELGDVYSYVTGVWWSLPVGDNTVRFAAFSFSGAARADFTWYNGYLL